VDCPYAHLELENALIRLREATSAMNRATDDPHTRTTLERTWLLQDRLVFPDQVSDAKCMAVDNSLTVFQRNSSRWQKVAFAHLAISDFAVFFTSVGSHNGASRELT